MAVPGDSETSARRGGRLFILGDFQRLAWYDPKQPDSNFEVGQGDLQMSPPIWIIVWFY